MRRRLHVSAGAVAVAAAVAAAVLFSGSTPTPEKTEQPDLPFAPEQVAVEDGSVSAVKKPTRDAFVLPRKPTAPGRRYLMVRVEKPLRTRYGLVRPHTELGSNTWLLVVSRKGPHATVLLPGEPTGRTVRLDLRKFPLRWTQMRVEVDQSATAMTLWNGTRRMGRWTVAVGNSAAPTPNGRFSVTDRVVFPTGGTYGRFALGLSVHQDATPPNWPGGDQVAIHGTEELSLLGQRVSHGCVRGPNDAMRMLRKYVPLGAPVDVHT